MQHRAVDSGCLSCFCNASLRGSKVHGQTCDRRVCRDQSLVGIKMNVAEDRRLKKQQLAPSCRTGSSSLSWACLTCCSGISALAAALSRSLKIKLDTKNQGSLPNPGERGEAERGMTTLQTFRTSLLPSAAPHLLLLLSKITFLPFFWILFGIENQNNPVLNVF